MPYSIFVDGQEGTTGLCLNEYLSRRTDITLLTIDPAQRKDATARRELLNASDLSFLCLPDAAARESVALVENPETCIIDTSTAHRTDPDWVFGLPELGADQRAKLRQRRRIANPGCHASAFILLVRPLVARGIMAADHPVAAHSITGYSGGGKKMIEQYRHAGDSLDAPRPYALELSHKHLPEMRVHSGLSAAPVFTPIVGPYYKGLAVTLLLHPQRLARPMPAAGLREELASHYASEPFIRVMPLNAREGDHPDHFDVQGCNDTNRVDIFVFGNADRVTLIARLDNLGKGASGAAVQSMNVHFGLDETLGLV